jgi:hypothetical protein
MQVIAFLSLFVLGRAVSLALYRMCWSNGLSGKSATQGAVFSLLRRPLPWLTHFAFIWPTASLSWEAWPLLHGASVMLAGLLALGAIGRFGSVDLGRFFLPDRLLALALAAGVLLSPVFIYPCLVACCCLQYTVASWRLGPGYSNLLGYEFIRASISVLIAAITLYGWMLIAGFGWNDFENHTLTVLLGLQASTYVNHSMAKSALGPKWNSWIRENRIQCLFTNAWLRGWKLGRSKECILKQTRWFGKHRVRICAAGWMLEASWLLILADPRLTLAILSLTILLHLTVFLLTGLAAYQYVANHLFFLGLILFCETGKIFGRQNLIACAIAIPIAALWIGWLRRRIFTEYQRSGTPGSSAVIADAADHLMAWWDTPFMRMYSYTIETRGGERFALPVPKLSPHDTALTDIHTHLMILGQHADLDPMIKPDRAIVRTGVWGLTVHREDRDFLYQLMNEPESEVRAILSPGQPLPPWSLGLHGRGPEAATPLRTLFEGMNREMKKTWVRGILRWPHFPGEDLAPDQCPLAAQPPKCFRFDQAIASVTLWRIKTFSNEENIFLIEQEMVGCIHLAAPQTQP